VVEGCSGGASVRVLIRVLAIFLRCPARTLQLVRKLNDRAGTWAEHDGITSRSNENMLW